MEKTPNLQIMRNSRNRLERMEFNVLGMITMENHSNIYTHIIVIRNKTFETYNRSLY